MRVEPQTPSYRGSEWPRPVAARQGDPVGARRATLTCRPVEAPPHANSLGKFAMCRIATCLILATLGTAPTAAQSGRGASRCSRKNLTSPKSPMGERAASDLERQARRKSSRTGVSFSARSRNLNLKLTKRRPFTTSFRDGDRTIIVSADALSTMCPSSHESRRSKLECPARVVELRGRENPASLRKFSDFRSRRSAVKLASTLRRTATRNT